MNGCIESIEKLHSVDVTTDLVVDEHEPLIVGGFGTEKGRIGSGGQARAPDPRHSPPFPQTMIVLHQDGTTTPTTTTTAATTTGDRSTGLNCQFGCIGEAQMDC